MAQNDVKNWNPVEMLLGTIKMYKQTVCMLRNSRFKGSAVHINAAKERRDTLVHRLEENIVSSRLLLVQYSEGETS